MSLTAFPETEGLCIHCGKPLEWENAKIEKLDPATWHITIVCHNCGKETGWLANLTALIKQIITVEEAQERQKEIKKALMETLEVLGHVIALLQSIENRLKQVAPQKTILQARHFD